MKKEYDLKKMKVVKRGAVVPRGTKISKTVRLDMEIIEWLVSEADRRGVKYQSLLNSLLKEVMLGGGSILTEDRVRKIVREELAKRAS